jgi:LysM repeat protein
MKKLIRLLTCAVLLAGCGENGAQRDAADEDDRYVRKGLEQVHLKNWDGAIEQFSTALEETPRLARPDLELALIYHQKKINYIRAVYHYERYLEKRPATEKRPLIQDWIRQAKISLAGEIGRAGGDISEELLRLTRENNLLRKQLEAPGRTPAAPASGSVKTLLDTPPPQSVTPAAATVPAEELLAQPETRETVVTPPAPVAPPVQPAVRTYQVRPGDTLTRISTAIYRDPGKWRKIYEANRDKMKNENDLKAGQTLVIPDL